MSRLNQNSSNQNGGVPSVGSRVRARLLEQVESMLAISEKVSDTGIRLLLQAHCLDLVSSIEELIEQYELDSKDISKTH